MKKRDVEVLKRRIETLEARLEKTDPNAAFYHEIKEELAALKRIRSFINEQTNSHLLPASTALPETSKD